MSSLFTSLWRTSDNSFVYRYKLINFELQKEEITTRVLELYRRTCSVHASPVWLKSTHRLYTMKFTLAPKHWWFLATQSIFKDSITRSILCSETNKNDKEKKKIIGSFVTFIWVWDVVWFLNNSSRLFSLTFRILIFLDN